MAALKPMGDAVCDNFEVKGDWAWARGRYGDLTRTLVAGPAYLLDVVELSGADDRLLELPLHLSGRVEVKPAGSWVPAELPDEFVSGVERFAPASPDPLVFRSCGSGDATLSAHLVFDGELIRALGPGAPGTADPVPVLHPALPRSRPPHHHLAGVQAGAQPLVKGSASERSRNRGRDCRVAWSATSVRSRAGRSSLP